MKCTNALQQICNHKYTPSQTLFSDFWELRSRQLRSGRYHERKVGMEKGRIININIQRYHERKAVVGKDRQAGR